MTSTFVNDLRLNEQETGDNSGSWGTVTNTNLTLIGEALGYGAQQVFGSDANATTTVADGAADPARAMYFKVTSAGNLTATRTMTIAPNTVSRLMFIENATSGSQSIAVSQGSGANVTIPAGDVKVIYTDGAGSGGAVVDAFASLSVVDLKVQDDLTVTDDVSIGGILGVTGVLTTTAATVFNGGFASNAASTVIAADGVADNGYVFTIKNQEATNDRSFGLRIEAGSTASDLAINIETHDGGTALFQLAGSGQARFLDGTASLPSISNLNGPDLNTGMYFPAADTVGFSAGGTERMRVTTDKVQFNVDAKVGTNDAHDLGANGARWKDLYLSGTANITGVLTTTAATVFNGGFASGATSTVTGDVDISGSFLAGGADSVFTENLIRFKSSGDAFIDHNTVGQDINFRVSVSGSNDTTALKLDAADAGAATFSSSLYIPSQLIHAGDTDTLFEFQGANSMRFKAGGNEVVEMTGSTVVFNDGSANYDIRMEGSTNDHLFNTDGSLDRVIIGSSDTSPDAQFVVKATNSNAAIAMQSITKISGSNQTPLVYEYVHAIDTVSTGNQLLIPITSQGSLHVPYMVEIMVATGEFNANANAKSGSAKFGFTSLTVLQALAQQQVTGNISSIALDSSNMKILVNFSSAYNDGSSNNEGVMVYAKVLGSHPQYFQLENAVMN